MTGTQKLHMTTSLKIFCGSVGIDATTQTTIIFTNKQAMFSRA